jgi:multimeric flavodoxin WrbA
MVSQGGGAYPILRYKEQAPMKILAFNSSPSMDKGNTALILNPFLEGMREAGAEVELFYTKKLRIKPCQGEFNCWLKTPGQCFQKDDMQMLLPKIVAANVLVFASPVYVDGISGPLKNLIDRMVPGALPFFELRDGHCRHPGRGGISEGKVVLVSNCGFWEIDNFDPLIVHMKAMCKNMNRDFAGALLRPQGPAFRAMLEIGVPVNDVLEAAREAGRQLVRGGKMSAETLSTVSRPLLSLEMYLEQVNRSFRKALEAVAQKA